jgi:hypothetical protein
MKTVKTKSGISRGDGEDTQRFQAELDQFQKDLKC